MPTKRNITVSNAGKPAARAIATAKPAKLLASVSAKPATVASVPPVPAIAVPVATVKRPAGIARTQATVSRGLIDGRGDGINSSDRDGCYFAFYAGIAKRDGGTVTVAALAAIGRNPLYTGSNKAHDARIIVRLSNAGIIRVLPDGSSFTFTERATGKPASGKAPAIAGLAAYTSAPVAKPTA